MADSKTFVARFDLLDNFSAKFDALQKRINTITGDRYTIGFDIESGSALQKTQELGKKLEDSTAGITNAVNGVNVATKNQTATQKEAGKAIEQHEAATKKADSSLSSLKARYENLTGSIDKLKSSLAGLTTTLAGGAIAGYSWKASEESALYSRSVYDMLAARKGAKSVDLDAIKAFVSKATDSGYTSSTDRLSLTNLMIQRGAKSTEQAMSAAEALEKKFFKDQVMLERDYGITSAKSLGEFATQKYIRGQQAKQDLDNLFGKGFSSKSQSARIKALQKVGIDVDINAAMAEQPLAVIQNRIKSVTKSIGSELRGVMSPIAGMFATILGIIDKNPVLPKILAISAVLTVVIGFLVTIIGLLPVMRAAILSVHEGFKILTAGSRLASFASMLMNPYAILIALAAIILVVAYKTGVLSDAWDKFTKSAMGGDIISAVGAVADVVGMVIDKFSEWYEASGRNQLLSSFMFLVEILGNAYDFMDKIYSLSKSATGNPLLAGITALASMPLALYAGGIKASTGVDVTEILESTHDRLTSIYRWLTSGLSSVMEKGTGLLGKLLSIFEMVVNPIIRLFNLVKDMFGRLFGGNIPGIEATPPTQLNQSDREDLINWAQGLTDSKGRVFNFGLNTEIWDLALKEALTGEPQELPYTMQDGGESYRRLVDTFWNRLKNPSEGLGDVAPSRGSSRSNPLYNPEFTNKIDTPVPGLEIRTKEPSEIRGSQDVEGGLQAAARVAIDKAGEGAEWTGKQLEGAAAWGKQQLGFAKGGYVERSGFALVHEGEPIIEAKVANSSRLQSILESIAINPAPARGYGDIHVHNETKIDLSGLKLSPGFDLEKLLREIDSRIERGSVKAVQNALGQRRT